MISSTTPYHLKIAPTAHRHIHALMQKDKKNHRNDYISYVLFKNQSTLAVSDIKVSELKNMLTALKERI